MSPLDRIAVSALLGDAIGVRSQVQDWLSTRPMMADVPPPDPAADATLVAVTAALAELLAGRLRQPPPAWTAAIGPADRPVYLVRAAERMRRLREACQAESPAPLRSRHIYAPANYLEAV